VTRRYKLELTGEQVVELTDARNHHEKAYVRERAAAILKVGQGQTIKEVAHRGLLRKRKEHAVKEWIVRYLQGGIAGLLVRSGRGRKPAFSPSARGGSQKGP
jgi:transposase